MPLATAKAQEQFFYPQRRMEKDSGNPNTTAERYSDAFVDNAQNGLNDAHLATPWTLTE